jgi:hypothetical protein
MEASAVKATVSDPSLFRPEREFAAWLGGKTLLGKNAGASGQDMADAQAGLSYDPKIAAALAFALKLVEHRGQVAQRVHQLRQHSARRSGGLPRREIPPRCLERVPINGTIRSKRTELKIIESEHAGIEKAEPFSGHACIITFASVSTKMDCRRRGANSPAEGGDRRESGRVTSSIRDD